MDLSVSPMSQGDCEDKLAVNPAYATSEIFEEDIREDLNLGNLLVLNMQNIGLIAQSFSGFVQ